MFEKYKLNAWKTDHLDPRDYKFKSVNKFSAAKHKPVNLTAVNPIIIDQGDLGSCTACASTSLINYVRKINKHTDLNPSVLFTYYTTRQIENTVLYDSGASLRSAIKSTVNYGITSETLWPYIVENFDNKPSLQAYTEAKLHQTLSYYRINNTKLADLLACLSQGFPFVFGFAVYDNFFTQSVLPGAYINLPNTRTNRYLGGHAVIAEGWETRLNKTYFICKNSWGSNFGDKGYFKIEAGYLTNSRLATDFWTVRTTEN